MRREQWLKVGRGEVIQSLVASVGPCKTFGFCSEHEGKLGGVVWLRRVGAMICSAH